MARGKGNTRGGSAKDSQAWTTFIEIRLTEEEKAVFTGLSWTPEEVYDQVATLLEHSYRLSFSYNNQSDATICSITCKGEGSVNEGCTITSFAKDWWTAVRLTLFKHHVVAAGDWKAAAEGREGEQFG